ncbi:MAG: TIGR00730 family Rossman fold protein [Candidatus Eremiobacteraeota bacterium]|nr:TIGR00730 family Rossman fold protein [Candidatus Eremiobacteraeota bacterium]MDQ6823309.1 TIGR00730 family Rossman fold protein [Candidatus Eremiobacteraeota bacterium]
MRRVCVFCGASPGNDVTYSQIARKTATTLAGLGYGIVFGGGRVGLMGVLANAALEAGAEVIGVIPESLARREIAHDGLTKLHVVESMHVRKALMADLSDAFIAIPGGYGTMDELCEIITWAQLGIHDKPVGLLNAGGFYDDLLRLFDHMRDAGFVSAQNRGLLKDAADIESLALAMKL